MNIVMTGASKGIGLATAHKLDQPHNRLFLTATSKTSFKEDFERASLFSADLTKPTDIDNLANEILQQTSTVDALINNVGVMIMKRFEDMSDDDINHMLDLNLRAHILLTRKLLPALRASQNPQIIFMSSMAAKSSIAGESVYAATKSGITNFANVLRNEFGPSIRVSSVHAWGVDTWGAPKSDEFIQPADVAATMEFILTRPTTVMVESIDLSNPHQWRGGDAPWSPKNK